LNPFNDMAKAYSADLRNRIVNTYNQGQLSIRETAQQFQVGKNGCISVLQ
jgi:transposase